ncbi:hypothetical protein LCGC14_1744210 [marine sediment metagenome]|uniref:ATP-dependent DNA ligase family profile domain-containing protein n=1 Tax=marine sediment metagenome TaxID=412755 RepID=A0A0F9H5U1_9ZZZZ
MITKPLLATAADLDKVVFPVIGSPKLDGIRCLKIDGRAVSRKFKPIPNDYIRTWIEKNCSDGFDGEILCLDPAGPFSEVSSMVMSKEHPAEKSFVYAVFDWVWKDQLDTPFSVRAANVETWFEQVRKDRPEITRHMRPVPQFNLDTREHLDAFHLEWVGVGYEGTMIRDPKGVYKCGRSTQKQGILLKIKDWIDEEAEVIGVVEQMENTNEAKRDEVGDVKRSTAKEGKVGKGTMGKLRCRALSDGCLFSVGTGWTDEERQFIWDTVDWAHDEGRMGHSIIGAIIKVKHQPDPGKKKRKPGVPPRFPQFIGYRNMEIDG